MRISAVDSFILRIPPNPPLDKVFQVPHLVVATIRTDQGLAGLGYTLLLGGRGTEAVQRYLQVELAPLLVGEDPQFVERLWEKMYRSDLGIRRQGLAGLSLSALDIGLWDIAGKAANLPLYKLWGAALDRVPAYGSGGFPAYSHDELVGEIERFMAMGCRYYKMKVHDPDPRVNRKRVEEVVRAIDGRARVMVDCNQRFDVLANVRQARMLAEFDLVWYEEPVLADDIAACADVARAIAIPVATGENNFNRYEFRELIERRAASYLMPDVCRANGFSEVRRIGQLAAAYELPITPHLVPELSIQLAASLSNSFLVEIMAWMPDDVFDGVPKCEDGCFRLTDRPGHGLALAPDAKRKYGLV